MLYRDHRGTLADSMGTVREVNTLKELKKYFNEELWHFYKEVEEIKIMPYEYDKRIDWDTHIVIGKLKGEAEFWVMGFTNGMIE
jgi:hypothetical protein